MSCKCAGIPIPKIFIAKQLSLDRKNWFMNNQYAELNGASYGETTSLDFSANDFISMLVFFMNAKKADSLRINFASYSEDESPNVPDGLGNKMTLLFSPFVNTGGAENSYYSVAPGSSFNPERSLLNTTIANEWIKNYENGQLVVFNKYVEHIPENLDPKTNQYSDTKSVIYDKNLLSNILTEISCQASDGVRIHFCAYLDTDQGDRIVPKRLVTHFGLIDASGNDYFPDDHDQSCRPPSPLEFYDNGQLCPTYCP